MRNPRTTEEITGIVVKTFDVDGYVIDENTSSPFSVKMTEMAEMDEFEVEYLNATNNALTDLLVSFKSVVPIKSGDRLHMQIPV